MVTIEQRETILERLVRYNPGQTNISADLLAQSHTGMVCNTHTFFFMKDGADILLPIAGEKDLVIPLSYADYRHDSGTSYELHPEQIDWIPGHAKELQGMKSLHELMTALDKVVNSTMRYDVNKLTTIIFGDLKRQDVTHTAERKRKPKTDEQLRAYAQYMIGSARANYKPTGNETWSGVCTDAGARWGEIMLSLDLNGVIFTDVAVRPDSYGSPHDTRCAIELSSGNWYVWNSKDPAIEFEDALPTREQLSELGAPYVRK